jgi:PPOX class probable F420-dependent enzyme
MLNVTSRFGRHVNRRLRQEKIIWLTTVDSHDTPQPRPVWFHWDDKTILIFSEKSKAKLRDDGNIAAVLICVDISRAIPEWH